jgi:hypothetical protein
MMTKLRLSNQPRKNVLRQVHVMENFPYRKGVLIQATTHTPEQLRRQIHGSNPSAPLHPGRFPVEKLVEKPVEQIIEKPRIKNDFLTTGVCQA